jgi:hypothetical protein
VLYDTISDVILTSVTRELRKNKEK